MKFGASIFLPLLALVWMGCSDSPAPAQSTMMLACVPGQQVACACPAGPMGVQVCNDQGSSLGGCDCIAPAFDAAADRASVVEGEGNGGSAGADSTDAASLPGDAFSGLDSTVDVQDASGPPDDPCPTAGTIINCSSTCPSQQSCPPATCSASTSDVIQIDTSLPGSIALRTPSHPGTKLCTDCSKATFSMMIVNVNKQRSDFRARVDPPWLVQSIVPGAPPCINSGTSCATVFEGKMWLMTDDPNAPSRTVIINPSGLCLK